MHSTDIRVGDRLITVHHNGDFSGRVLVEGEAAADPASIPFALIPSLTAVWLTTLAEEALEDGDFTRLIQLSTALATIQHELGDTHD